MDRVVDLLERKNHFLEKFHLISEAELLNFESGDYDNIESFYECREKILNIINHIEKDFEKTFSQYSEAETFSASEREEVDRVFKRKGALVGKILDLDLKIISAIDFEKSEIIKELRSLKDGKKVLEGYRVPVQPRHVLNEEI